MKLLSRYLLRQNLFLMFTVLGVGVGIYLLSDLFDRLDDFLEAKVHFKIILTYFVAKMPLIISQILPAVFLISCTLQLCFMARSRELVALQAGGISFARLARFFVVYGLIWAVAQLAFSQYIGIEGEAQASRIWREDVRGKNVRSVVLHKLWFKEGDRIFFLNSVWPEQGKADHATVYELEKNGDAIHRVIRAETVTTAEGGWTFHNVQLLTPDTYDTGSQETLVLPVEQKMKTFAVIDPRKDPQKLPIWQLYGAIERLRQTGSNVEALRTALHMKFAYAASVMVMGLIALALITWRDNVYINVGFGLVCTFAFYALFTVGGSMGQKGIVPPLAGAWGAVVIFGGLALLRIVWHTRSRS